MTFREFYEELLGKPIPAPSGNNPNVSIQCFHHDDEHNSCSLNTENGTWFCHATGEGGGVIRAIAIVREIPIEEAVRIAKKHGIDASEFSAPKPTAADDEKEDENLPVIEESVNDVYKQALRDNPDALARARTRFGWNDETIEKREIGWHEPRYTIPIRDKDKRIRNLRMYDPDSSGTNKLISWKEGHGKVRLYPLESLEAQTIYIVEGEKDCILLNQVIERAGVADTAAITGTGGAGTWKDIWSPRFSGKDVIIIYDRDQRGAEGAQRVAKSVAPHAASVKVVELDIATPEGADITDYFVSHSKDYADLRELVDLAQPFTTKRAPRAKDTAIYRPHLSEASHERYIDKNLSLKVMIAGKDLSPFAVPAKVEYTCDQQFGTGCNHCAVHASNGSLDGTIPADDPDLIRMTRVDDRELMLYLRKRFGVHGKCPRVEIEKSEYHDVEEVTVVPEIDFSEHDHEYVTRTAYVVQHGIRPNRAYTGEGTAVPHPKTQNVVHFFQRMEPTTDSIEEFEMDERKIAAMKVFQPAPGQTVKEKFAEIARDLSANVTRIYGREDIVTGVDLCFHTVIDFMFQGKKVAKPWGDILIIGDTRTGKTETVQALIFHYKLGEMAVGENSSFAGLVGGLKQEIGKRWNVMWGKIPLNDRRLLAIDELSGLDTHTISQMSSIRSDGQAEMAKIVTQKTMARTRLIFISNPRADLSMSQYAHGVEAIRELIGRPEDIARFDFVLSAATNEVPVELINARKHDEVPHIYTSDICRMLVLWAWSRKSEDITFTDEAIERILDLAVEQSSKYASGSISLVEGGNHRLKLAKLAVAAACRTFSTDDEGRKVIVRPEHVEFVAEFLDQIYRKPSLDYYGWSQVQLVRSKVSEQAVLDAVEWIDEHPDWAELWLTKDHLRLEDFKTQFDLETKDARQQIFAPLGKLRMIERGSSSTYIKTPPFIRALKETLQLSANGASRNGSTPHPAPQQTKKASDQGIPF